MAEKKKILYIVEAMGGGVFTYIVDLANELVNKYDMYIAYAVRKQTPKNYKDYFDKRIHLIEVKNFGRAIDPVKDIAAFFEVKKIAAEIKPDIIHLHSSKAGAIGRMAFNGKIPMFYTIGSNIFWRGPRLDAPISFDSWSNALVCMCVNVQYKIMEYAISCQYGYNSDFWNELCFTYGHYMRKVQVEKKKIFVRGC